MKLTNQDFIFIHPENYFYFFVTIMLWRGLDWLILMLFCPALHRQPPKLRVTWGALSPHANTL
ncbi:hypothetical protein [Aeromonas veronii]|uniref:hypothetical protein n=1 Tax=Aeromonas veronii TaxID=654 RepID=UPI003BA14B25